ncbi:hypothetical protein QYM36_014728, partial [Artemia franciscana]
MPNRDDFETEYDNDAELLVSHLDLNATTDEDIDMALKLAQVDMYQRRLRERAQRKRLVRDYQLAQEFFIPIKKGGVDVAKKITDHRKKLIKADRDLFDKFRPFVRFHTFNEHEQFLKNLSRARQLRTRIRELLKYRKNGLTRSEECVEYERQRYKREKKKEDRKRSESFSIGSDEPDATPSVNGSGDETDPIAVAARSTTRRGEPYTGSVSQCRPSDTDGSVISREEFATLPGFELLTNFEQNVCYDMKIRPSHFVNLKTALCFNYAAECKGLLPAIQLPSCFSRAEKSKPVAYTLSRSIMESWQPFEPEVQINPYTLCLPNVTISEVAGSANSNSESENEQNNDDFYIDAVPEVMISDDTERTELFDILNSNKRKRSESEIWQGCCAPGCFSSTANFKKGQKKKSFFQFPDDKEKATDWARRAGILNLIESILTDRKSFHLCSDHFSKEMLVESNEGSQLVPDAVPFEVLKLSVPELDTLNPSLKKLETSKLRCPYCSKTFRDKFNLRKHMTKVNKCTDITGTRSDSVVIDFGGDEMVSGMIPPPPEVITPKPQRLQPTSVSTPRKKPRVTCHVCGKSLGDAWKLKRHLSSLNKCSSRPWNCGSCEAVYKTELELYDHILTHPE